MGVTFLWYKAVVSLTAFHEKNHKHYMYSTAIYSEIAGRKNKNFPCKIKIFKREKGGWI